MGNPGVVVEELLKNLKNSARMSRPGPSAFASRLEGPLQAVLRPARCPHPASAPPQEGARGLSPPPIPFSALSQRLSLNWLQIPCCVPKASILAFTCKYVQTTRDSQTHEENQQLQERHRAEGSGELHMESECFPQGNFRSYQVRKKELSLLKEEQLELKNILETKT